MFEQRCDVFFRGLCAGEDLLDAVVLECFARRVDLLDHAVAVEDDAVDIGQVEGLCLVLKFAVDSDLVRVSTPADEIEKVRAALVETFDDRSLADCREILLLKGVTLATQEDYWVFDDFQDYADRLGYPVLQ